MPGKPRLFSLTFKVNLILIAALAVGIGAIMVAFAVSLVAFRNQLTIQSLMRQGDDHFVAIETLMISGNAPEAVGYFTKVNLTNAATTITLYRRDGTRAFSDNTTIERVNQNLKMQRFLVKDRPPAPGATVPTPRFAEAAGLPPQELFFRDDEGFALGGGKAYFRAYRPLINLPKCTVCHGADHTVRGVIDIRSDVTSVVKAQAVSIGGAGVGFFVMVAILAFVIGSFLRRVVLRPVQSIGKVCIQVTSGNFDGRVKVGSNDEIGVLARTVNTMVGGLHERFELTKYVSAGTIGAITAGQEPKRVLRTLLFTDVRGFTSYTERHRPEQVVNVLNRILEKQSEIIQSCGGDIDKFVGDEILAVFSGDKAPSRACTAALRMVRLCAESVEEFEHLAVGVGIATGSVIHGMVGSARRADFTVIGDSVNLASRLCGIAKGMQIIVCSAIHEAVAAEFEFKGPFTVKLKGKIEQQKVWLLSGSVQGRSS
jgi:class 3 adenylate cyclase